MLAQLRHRKVPRPQHRFAPLRTTNQHLALLPRRRETPRLKPPRHIRHPPRHNRHIPRAPLIIKPSITPPFPRPRPVPKLLTHHTPLVHRGLRRRPPLRKHIPPHQHIDLILPVRIPKPPLPPPLPRLHRLRHMRRPPRAIHLRRVTLTHMRHMRLVATMPTESYPQVLPPLYPLQVPLESLRPRAPVEGVESVPRVLAPGAEFAAGREENVVAGGGVVLVGAVRRVVEEVAAGAGGVFGDGFGHAGEGGVAVGFAAGAGEGAGGVGAADVGISLGGEGGGASFEVGGASGVFGEALAPEVAVRVVIPSVVVGEVAAFSSSSSAPIASSSSIASAAFVTFSSFASPSTAAPSVIPITAVPVTTVTPSILVLSCHDYLFFSI
ncbi:hypothetical protein GRF29_19g71232 [Pseudopithomyces chartarum]|uniref:Uncharacterized protein n=1 Tax=Pseudopithomyces chartarum TaxID=1892770 RepID=A0AAN6M223_9PLEO|nr:hypothetical protein GRF29_19g71232 [Pseudopithomyces chartarum]